MSGDLKYWSGTAPTVCQVCDRPIVGVFVDGKTQWDCWAFMCRDCWEMHGEGLGLGLGQMYGRQADGRWLKLNDKVFANLAARAPAGMGEALRQMLEDGDEPSLIRVPDDHAKH